MLFFGDVAGSKFGQHVHHQFLIGHIITKVLLLEAFEVFVFTGG